MLVQPPRNLDPLTLLSPEIPGAIAPLPPAETWGINIAAARDNFPDQGLKVQIPVWSNKGLGDKVELLLGTDDVVDQHTISDPIELSERATLFVPPSYLQTGAWSLAYRVKRLNQTPETFTPALKLDVKLELPAGQDTDPGHGHSGLYMALVPPQIVQEGVDKDSAKNGVDLIIRAKPDSGSDEPYEHIAVGDVITATWGGKLVKSAPVTQAQIDTPASNPIKVHIDEATILAAGDSGREGLAASFMVRDRVLNQSEDWCKETRIVVDTGNSRLDAPILEQAIGNVLDLDTLGDEPLILQVWASDPNVFKVGDVIIMNLTGTTLDGDAIDVKVREQITNVPSVVKVPLSNTAARALAKTQVMFAYTLERDDDTQRSKGRFVSIIGEPQRLAAPIAEDAQQGALDPDLPLTTIRIPYDPAIQEGMAIELKWFGIRADTSAYEPELDWFFPNREEAEDPAGFSITVEGKHLKTLEGGTLTLSYTLHIDEGGIIVKRESLQAALLNVGEARFELVEPIVLGEQDGTLEPKDLPGGVSKLTAPRPTVKPTKANDVVTYTWTGDVTGKKEDSTTLNELSKDMDVNFTLNATFVSEHIEPNRGKKVTASYRIWRAETNETSYSNVLEFVVGVAVALTPPTLVSPATNPIDALSHPNGVTVRVDFSAALPGDKARLFLMNPLPESPTFADLPLDQKFALFTLDATFLGRWHGKVPRLAWTLIRGGQPVAESAPLVLTVNQIAHEDPRLSMPTIDGATPEGVLDVTKMQDSAQLTVAAWLLQVSLHRIWLRYDGFDKAGDPTDMVTWAGAPHASASGVTTVANTAWLRTLKDGSKVTITFGVNFDKKNDAATMVRFPVRIYTIKAALIGKPVFTNPPYIIDPSGQVKDIVIQLADDQGQPVPGVSLTLTLPAGFTYADGGSGSREFTVGSDGTVTVSGVKGHGNPGTYHLIAISGEQSITEKVTIVGVIQSIPVGTFVQQMVLSPDGSHVYASHGLPQMITVIDTVALKVVNVITEGGGGIAIAISRDGTRLVTTFHNPKTISFYDAVNQKHLQTINNPQDLTSKAVAISPDGKRAFFPAYTSVGPAQMMIVDVERQQIVKVVPFGTTTSFPHSIALSLDGTRAVVFSVEKGVAVFNTVNETFFNVLPDMGHSGQMVISPDGSRAVIGREYVGVSIIDAVNWTLIKTFPLDIIDFGSRGVAFTPDGTRVYVSGRKSVFIVNIATLTVEKIISVEDRPLAIAISPDGTRAYIAINDPNKVIVMAIG